jgi:Ca-activated chloride channel family protein
MNLFQFKNPEFLWLLFVIPLLFAIYFIVKLIKRRVINKLGDSKLIQRLYPDYSGYRMLFKFCLTTLVITLLIIALARPQKGSKVKTETVINREIIFALDVSNSMLAEDILPNRLKRAKELISEIHQKNKNDKFGLVVFAGDAYVQIPSTNNLSSLDLFLESVNTNSVPVQGTIISKAIEISAAMFDKSSNNDRLLLILTDGENHEQAAIEAAKAAHDKGISISTIGIGRKTATPVPNPLTGDYKKENGNIVLTKLNDVLLTQIANAGGGEYIGTENYARSLKSIQNQIDAMGTEGGETEVEEYADLFPGFILAALFFLLFEFVLLERRNKKLSELKLFN